MYRFQNGKFKGRTLEHILLRSAPRLYSMIRWARKELPNQPHLGRLVHEFDSLRKLLQDAPVSASCAKPGCERKARWMTFIPDWTEGYFWLGPKFWCNKHGPMSGEEEDDESQKIPINFDAIDHSTDKRNKRAIHRGVLEAFGISKKPSRITEKFAHRFFQKLRSK